VVYEQLESGEHVILTAGELHLERCLKDLRERFARCDIQAGEAIVPYRESIVRAEEMNPPKNAELGRGRVEATTSSGALTVRLWVKPLPALVTEFLVRHTGAVKRLYSERMAQERERTRGPSPSQTESGRDAAHSSDGEHVSEQEMEAGDDGAEGGQALSLAEFKKGLVEAFAEEKGDKEVWKDVVEKIAAFGPRQVGPNLLIDETDGGLCGKL
jgi:ribosome assembly protein 1